MDALAKNAWRTKIAELGNLMLGSQPRPGAFIYAILIEEDNTGVHALTFAHGHMDSETILITAHNALLDVLRGNQVKRHWWQRS
jgi:hypothetical protein